MTLEARATRCLILATHTVNPHAQELFLNLAGQWLRLATMAASHEADTRSMADFHKSLRR